MLYVFTGDREKARTKLGEIRGVLQGKRPDAEMFTIDTDSLTEHDLTALAATQGLFEKKYIITLDSVFTEGGADPALIELLAQSHNAFLALEVSPQAKLKTQFQKHADDVFDFPEAKQAHKTFSAFSLADALGSRDKKKLWTLFREAVARGYAMEEIHGILFWQMKMIILAHATASPEEAGVKQFPYSKAKRFTQHFTKEEAQTTLEALTNALLESRERSISLEHSLERTLLSI